MNLSAQVIKTILPKSNSFLSSRSVHFEWNAIHSASSYQLVISTDSAFNTILFDSQKINSNYFDTYLSNYAIFYWRVRFYSANNPSAWSSVHSFEIFVPNNLPSNQLWLSADSGIVKDQQGFISQWSDLSGNGNHAIQLNQSEKPKHLNAFNGHASVDFDGNSDNILVDGSFDLGTVMMLFNWTGANTFPDFNGVLSGNGGPNDLLLLGLQGSTSAYSGIYLSKQFMVNNLSTFNLAPLNQYKIVSCAPSGPISLYNGVRIGSDRNISTRFWKGNVIETLVFSNELNASEVLKVYNYLSYKYAPPVNLGANKRLCALPYTLRAKQDYITNYSWQNGSVADSFVVTSPGTYYLQTKDIFNKVSSDTIQIELDNQPYTVELGNDTSICSGQEISLIAGQDHLDYLWSNASNSNKITISASGLYSVSVKDCLGNISKDTISIQVSPLPAFSLGSDTLICYNQPYILNTNQNPPSLYHYLWSNNSTDSVITVNRAGQYICTVTNNIGCAFSDTVEISVDSTLFAATLGPDTAFCSGNYLSLTNGQNIVTTYLWQDGSINPSFQVNQQPGTFQYSLQIKNANACSKKDTISVQISGLAANVQFRSDTSVCFGSLTNFTDFSLPPPGETIVSRVWDFGDNQLSSDSSTAHLYSSSGTYTVKLTVFTSGGCSSNKTTTVKINSIPIADFTFSNISALTASNFQNTTQLNGNNAITWSWNFGDTLSGSLNYSNVNSPSHYFLSQGNYSISLLAVSEYGCKDSISKTAAVNPSLPTTLVYPKNGQFLANADSVLLNWNFVSMADNYEINVSKDVFFGNGIVIQNTPLTSIFIKHILAGTYYWRVRYFVGENASTWSSIFSFKIADLSNLISLQAWLRADKGIQKDSLNRIYKWSDLSGKNHHAVQQQLTAQPTLNLGLNNLSTLHFDGLNDELLLPDTFRVSQLFLVFNWSGAGTSFPDFNGLISAKGGASQLWLLGTQGSTSFYGGYFTNRTFINGTAGVDLAPLKKYKLLTAAGIPSTRCEGVILGSDRSISNRFWDGNISEVLMFDSILNSQDSAIVTDYLSNKYAPPLNLGPDKTVCGFPITLKAGKEYFKNYLWSNGSNNDSIVITNPGKYALTTTDIFNKTSIDSIHVFWDSTNYSLRSIYDTVICAGSEIVIVAGPPHLQYNWSNQANGNAIQINKTGIYSVSVVDCRGNVLRDTFQVQVNPIPTFDLGRDTLICYNNELRLSPNLSSAVPNYYQYLWSNNSTDSVLIPTQSSNYILKVTDPYACSFSDSVKIEIDSLLYNASLGNDTVFCSGNSIELQTGVANVNNYLWSNGSNAQSIQVVQPIGNDYPYWLDMTDINGCKKRDSILVSINGIAPLASFAFDTSLCNGSPAQFNDFSTAPAGETIISWEWDFGDGFSSTNQNPVHLYATYGNYNVRLKITSNSGCYAQNFKSISIHPIPIASFSNPVSCERNTTLFNNNTNTFGNPVQSYLWSFNDPLSTSGNSSFLKNPKHVFSVVDTFRVSLIVTTIYGCTDSIYKDIITKPSPNASFASTISCEGFASNIFDNSTYPFPQYALGRSWNFNDGSAILNSTQQQALTSLDKVFSSSGIFPVTLYVLGSNGCTDSLRKNVYVVSQPKADFSYTKNCLNNTTEFYDQTYQDSSFSLDSVISWKWKIDNTMQSMLQNPVKKFSTKGSKSIQLMVETTRGCRDTITKIMVIKDPPIAAFQPSTLVGDPPLTIDFTNNSSAETLSFLWDFGDSSSSVLQNPSHVYSDTGSFSIVLLVRDSNMCISTVEQTVFVKQLFLDIGLLALRSIVDAENFIHVSADIQNKSTRIIHSIDFYNQIGGSIPIKEVWQGSLPINGFLTYDFSGSTKLDNISSKDYVCVRSINPNGSNDFYPFDNELCISIDDEKFDVAEVYPNPSNNEVSVPFSLPEEGSIGYRIFDHKGSIVSTYQSNNLAKGLNLIKLDITALRKGFYAVQIVFKDESRVKSFIKY